MALQPDTSYHVTIEVVNKQCKGLRTLKDLGIRQYTLSDIRGMPGGSTRHLVRVSQREMRTLPEDVIAKIRDSGLEDEAVWFDSDGCDVCNAILSHKSFLISGSHMENHTILYTFVAPNFAAFQGIISTLESRGFQPRILEVGRFKRKGRILTEKQERALLLALRLGFFEIPRKITTRELSRRLGVVLSTASENIRRGIRKLVKDHFET